MNEHFLNALENLIAEYRVARTNTPLDVLARHMAASLEQFETSLILRADHPFFAPGKK